MTPSLPFRQIHLDFHTSEAIPRVAEDFDPQVFAAILERAHVNSINLFARCHHGWLYYDSRAFPDLVHPGLARRDLLRQQIAACQARGIRTPVYLTVQWDHRSATQHPEWLTLGVDGKPLDAAHGDPFQPGFYRYLCVNSPYRDFLKDLTREVLQTLPVDGLWFDIVQPVECVCRHCQAQMESRGMDPAIPADRAVFAVQSINAFKRDMTAFVRQFKPDSLIFYNAGHIGPRHRDVIDAFTHLELESLPSGGWGYIHFPLTVRYARTLGLDRLGMNGKFHTSWGDFHSFKNLAALQYEVFLMLALNARCCVGDQLHPSGALSPATYDLIGEVYAQVEEKEPWCEAANQVTEIGVLTPEEFQGGGIGGLPPALMGAVRMLTELGHQFDILDSRSDFRQYALLILPDQIPVDASLAARLQAYLADGGKLLLSYRSGLDPSGSDFALPEFGVRLVGEALYSPDFLLPAGAMGAGLPATEHVMYLRGTQAEALPGSAVMADTVLPYFNRTYKHFCSHRHTPSDGRPGAPGVVQQGSVIYFSHPIFTQYNDNAPRWVKIFLSNALRLLLPDPLFRHTGPSTLVTAINEQPAHGRQVVHLLHYIPERRGQAFDTIEDVIPLYDIALSLRVAKNVVAVSLVPQGQELPFKQAGGRVEFRVPVVEGHQMVAVQFD